MALGVLASLGVGFGLMALIFYSSRKGYDEPPVLILPDGNGNDSKLFPRAKYRYDINLNFVAGH